ncbi:Sapep family Mn(2+)-dependent dipeptidase [Metamycoplasma hyosynoviae]|nr:Sapep family Mn(2+)-dependent dipeptidase [Metamycoplasma hyosynoviae]MDD7896534.1 Sapep family Mn(2+)-dependent dipeptidase [Metamycoplasma hyosynoviae]
MKEYIKYQQSDDEFNQMVDHIAKLCAIPSISKLSKDKDAEYPFGIECNRALNYVLKLAYDFGFKIYKDSKKRFGFAQIGKGEKIMCIFTHLDVVPEGNKNLWTSSAFEPIKDEDKLFGRGTLDDKGPTIINIYAMKYIKDHKLLDKDWSIRIVFGLAEETNMLSMKAYKKEFGHPTVAYTPDGAWPLIYAEKLIYHMNVIFPTIPGLVLDGGKVINQIPDALYVYYPNIKEMQSFFPENETVYDPKRNILKIIGKSGHGSTPDKGDNAIIKFFKRFAEFEPKLKSNSVIKFMAENFFDGTFDMHNVFKKYEDQTGTLTANLGIVKTIPGYYVFSFDFRVPVSFNRSNIFSDLTKYIAALNKKINIEPISYKPAKYVSKENKLVKILMNVYNEKHQTELEPISIGGGTYARIFKNCVAFGSTEFMHIMHGPNEFFTYVEMKDSLEIYINALNRLQEYDVEPDLGKTTEYDY